MQHLILAAAASPGDLVAARTQMALSLAAAFGLASLALPLLRRFTAVRVTAALAVVAVLWGWAVGQYPQMLEPSLTVEAAAASPATLRATLASLGVGALPLVPSLAWLFFLFQRRPEVR
jgi:cytochrome d ubiquinol oxidase subunit II